VLSTAPNTAPSFDETARICAIPAVVDTRRVLRAAKPLRGECRRIHGYSETRTHRGSEITGISLSSGMRSTKPTLSKSCPSVSQMKSLLYYIQGFWKLIKVLEMQFVFSSAMHRKYREACICRPSTSLRI
jgi:hypothetical protein